MAKIDLLYQDLLNGILHLGYEYEDPNRAGVKRLEVTDADVRFDLTDGFPALTIKRLAWKSVVAELLWFLRGSSDVTALEKNKVSIWTKDGYAHYKRKGGYASFEHWLEQMSPKTKDFGIVSSDYDLGPIYGVQWRNFGGVDQISSIVRTLKTNPMSTQMIVSAWNPSQLSDMALPPCHYEFQVVARPLTRMEKIPPSGAGKTHGIMIVWSQRSVDTFLGLPFNIASYALLCEILAHLTGTVALGVKGNLKNVHLYSNSLAEAQELVSRDPYKYGKCTLKINEDLLGITELEDFLSLAAPEDFTLEGYDSYSSVKVEMLARD